MKIKIASIALVTAAGCSIASFSAPAATAYELKVSGDVCTYTTNEQDFEDDKRLTANIKEAQIRVLKQKLPAVSAQIEQLFSLSYSEFYGEHSIALRGSIEAEAIKVGFAPGEIAAHLTQIANFQEEALFSGANGDSITKSEALFSKVLLEETSIFYATSYNSKAYQDFIAQLNEQAEVRNFMNAISTFLQNCIDGRSGSHRLTNGGNAFGSGAFGSSSFGSS
ncbi:hypothetical protein [Corynebacterium callunae]|uniref:hypothetical protein n=1 Tax=Corynebacterium callunae TaxID=1721 RepID=UPI001FFE2EA4|nr:hypothetical protein [Corynebacterium callunae]MCK2200663.1 hypothetical protein [Corynebacterium callunae]